MSSDEASSSDGTSDNSKTILNVIIIGLPTLVGLCIFILVIYCCCIDKKKEEDENEVKISTENKRKKFYVDPKTQTNYNKSSEGRSQISRENNDVEISFQEKEDNHEEKQREKKLQKLKNAVAVNVEGLQVSQNQGEITGHSFSTRDNLMHEIS
jgi:preprotein translocase subunit SecF